MSEYNAIVEAIKGNRRRKHFLISVCKVLLLVTASLAAMMVFGLFAMVWMSNKIFFSSMIVARSLKKTLIIKGFGFIEVGHVTLVYVCG